MVQLNVHGLRKFIMFLMGTFSALFVINCFMIALAYKTGHHSLGGLFNLFYFDAKYNFPIYFSTFCLILCSIFLYTIYRFHKQKGLRQSTHWLVLAVVFLYISIDEFTNLHGMASSLLQSLLHARGLLYYTWIIPGFIVCIALALYFLPFYANLPKHYKVLFGVSALLYVGGALILEPFAARFAPNVGQFSLPVALAGTIKQTIQWSGELLFLYSLVDYLGHQVRNVQLLPPETASPETSTFSDPENGPK